MISIPACGLRSKCALAIFWLLAAVSCSVSYLEDRLVEIAEIEVEEELCTVEVDTVPGGVVSIDPPGNRYPKGSLVKITAAADDGFTCAGFSGTVAESGSRLVLAVEKDEWLIPVFEQLDAPPQKTVFRIRVDTSTGGGVRTEPEGSEFEKGTLVSITAVAAAGFSFAGWKGTRETVENPYVFAAEKNEWIHPVFAAKEPVKIPEAYAINISQSPGGTANLSPQSAAGYAQGTLVSLQAVCNSGYEFAGWTGTVESSANPVVLAVDGNEWIIPVFKKKAEERTFTVRIDNSEGGSTEAEGTKTAYRSGDSLKLTAKPAEGWRFASWGGTIAGSAQGASMNGSTAKSNPLILTVVSDEWIFPVFEPVQPAIEPEKDPLYALHIDNALHGSVSAQPSKEGYPAGEFVRLAAEAEAGYEFAGWTGTVDSSANPLVLAVDGNEWIIPVFKKTAEERTFTVRIDRSEGGSIECEGEKTAYRANDAIKLTAIAADGWRFVSWGGTIAGSAQSGSMNASSAKANPIILSIACDEWIFPVFERLPAEPEPEPAIEPESPPLFAVHIDDALHGSVSAQPSKEGYLAGEFIRLAAEAEAGYEFAGWTGTIDSCANPLVLAVDGNEWIIPVFKKTAEERTFTVRIDRSEGGSIECEGEKTAYRANDAIKLTAEPADGWKFVSWGGTIAGSAQSGSMNASSAKANPIILSIACDEWIFPVFERLPAEPEPEPAVEADPPREYAVKVDEAEHGSVLCAPEKPLHTENELVRLFAQADDGYEFESWSGTITSIENPLLLRSTRDEWLIPVFSKKAEAETCILKLDSAEGGTAVAEGAKASYLAGDTVKLRATAQSGWKFVSWSGTISEAANPFILEINKNEWIFPVFEPVPPVLDPAPEPEPVPESVPEYRIRVDPAEHGSVLFEPAKTTYAEGELVRLFGKATNTYEFAFWSGTITSTENPLFLRAERDEWIIPVFRKKTETSMLTLKLDSAEGGTAVADGSKASYLAGDTVKLRATAQAGWRFVSWSGTINTVSNPFILEINKNEWIFPIFEPLPAEPDPVPANEPDPLYTINLDGAAGGTATAAPAKQSYIAGEFVRLSATPDAGYSFVSWSGSISSTQNPLIHRIAGSEWIIPVFAKNAETNQPETVPEYSIRADSVPNGTSTLEPEKQTFKEGDFVKITATPAPGYLFSGWTGTVQSMQNPLVLRVADHAWLIPEFTRESRYTLVTEKQCTGGRVTASPDKSTEFVYGEFCTLKAEADPGYAFTGWYGDASGTQPIITVCMTRDLAVHPQFALVPVEPQYALETGPASHGRITRKPDKAAYGINETVYLEAKPDDGYMFRGWTGDASGDGAETAVTITGNMSANAEFIPASWTHLVYMSADNSLDSQALNDLNEMEAASKLSEKGMTVLALVDRKYGNGDWSDTRLYEIRNTPGSNSAAIVSQRLDCPELGLSASMASELNMADPVTLERFIAFALSSRKAERYSLTIWGHGTGWRGMDGGGSAESSASLRAVAIDDTSGSFMDIGTLAGAVASGMASAGGGGRMDVIGIDACFGSLLETAYPLRNDASFLVASEGPTKETGWNYAGLLNAMSASNLEVSDWCEAVELQFAQSYASTEFATISVIRMDKVEAMQDCFNQWARSIAQQVESMSGESARIAAKDAIRKSLLTEIDSFCYPASRSDLYADVWSMAETLDEQGFGDCVNLTQCISEAVASTWSCAYGKSRRQIGVFVNAISASRIFETSHSSEYTAGSGAVLNPFVSDTDGWVPSFDKEKTSFLNMLFY